MEGADLEVIERDPDIVRTMRMYATTGHVTDSLAGKIHPGRPDPYGQQTVRPRPDIVILAIARSPTAARTVGSRP